jgi:hypothetical protein
MAKSFRNKANASSRLDEPVPDLITEESSPNRSQDITVRPTLKMLTYVSLEQEIGKTTMEFHMTIRTKVSELNPKQASMLLSVANARAVFDGIDFTLYLAMEFLTNFLKKSGVDVLYVKNEKVRQTLLVAELVLAQAKGSWLNLVERERLPKQVIEEILALNWLPSDRTLNSWKQHWDLERYLSVRIVPMESLLNRTPSTAERYSGYTRGYGQDGNAPSPGKTRPTSELDGTDFVELPPHFTLQEYDKYQTVLLAIERAKMEKRRK